MTIFNVSELINQYRNQRPEGTIFSLHLDFNGFSLRLETNEERLRGVLSEYFAPFVTEETGADVTVTALETAAPRLDLPFRIKEPDPGKTKIKEEYLDLNGDRIVRKRLTGMVFVFGASGNYAIGPCLENSNQIVNFINNRFIQWTLHRGALLGHAAAVIHNGRGLAMAGFSGTGKSTLALKHMSLGATFVSNDRLMIDRQGTGITMYGVAKLPRINPGTILNNPNLTSILSDDERTRLASLPIDELWGLERKYDVDIAECFGPGRFVLRSEMHGLIILSWRRGGGPTRLSVFDPAQRSDLLPAFMKSEGLFFMADKETNRDTSAAAYADRLKSVCCLEISGGIDFDLAADAGMRFLSTGRFF